MDDSKKIRKGKLENILNDAYFKFQSPQAFSGYSKLQKAVKKKLKDVKKYEIENFLLSDRIHSLYKPRKKVKIYRKILVKYPFETLSLDLLDLQSLKTRNKLFSYLCVCICNFSKFLIIEKIKKKSKECMKKAMIDILQNPVVQEQKVKFFNTDRGELF